MKRALLWLTLFIVVLFVLFILFVPREGKITAGKEAEAHGAARTVSLVWSLGPGADADLGKNRITVTARGTADPKTTVNAVQAKDIALRTARHLAYEKLAEIIGGIRVVSSVTYRDLDPTGDLLTTRVDALVKGATIEREHVTMEKKIPVGEVTLSLPLFEKKRGLFTRIGDLFRSGRIAFSVEGIPSPSAQPKGEGETPAQKVQEAAAPAVPRGEAQPGGRVAKGESHRSGRGTKSHHSGVLFTMAPKVDNMAALPRIIDSSGKLLVNLATDIPYDILVKGPVVVSSRRSSLLKKTVGKKPLKLHLSTSPEFEGDLIVQDEVNDADRDFIYTSVSQGKFAFLIAGGQS